MKNKFLGLVLVIFVISIACSTLTPSPSSSNVSEPVLKVNPPTTTVENEPQSISMVGWVKFTSKDNLYTIDIPKNWLMGHWDDGLDYFVDNFQSPDSKSYLEVFLSDDGRSFPAVDEKHIYALSVLDRLYSSGVEVENRKIEENGEREILVWTSQNSRFISVYEVTNETTFVMLTIFEYSSDKESSTEVTEIIKNFKVQQNLTSESLDNEIEYVSVAEALTELSKKDGAKANVSEGWTIVTEDNGTVITMWSFAPTDNPAYPAVAKRVFYEEQNSWYVDMNILCESSKQACDKFGKDFEYLNEQMQKYIVKEELRKFLEEQQGN